jgi:hypothetical protein
MSDLALTALDLMHDLASLLSLQNDAKEAMPLA